MAKASRIKLSGALFVCFALSIASAAAENPRPLKVGVLTTLTGPGAVLSGSGNFGYRLAFQELESRGVAGRPLQLVWGDDQGDPTIGVGEAKRLIEAERVEILIGPVASPVALAIAPIVNDAKIAEFSVAGSNLLTPEKSHYHFSTSPNSDIYAAPMVDYVVDAMKAKAPAMLTDSGATSKSAAAVLRKDLEERGVPLVAAEEYPPPTSDLTPQILALRRRNPDVLLVSTTTLADFGTLVRNLAEVGWDVKIVGSLAIGTVTAPVVQVAGPDAFKNTVAVTYRTFTYCPGENLEAIDGPKFIAKLKAFAPKDFEHISIMSAAGSYDSVYLMKAAIEGAGATDAAAITDWVERNAGSVHAFTGKLSASRTKHALADAGAMAIVQHPEIRNAIGLTQRAACP
jgi:branched-chain amino acid transport system substrate-binding protein